MPLPVKDALLTRRDVKRRAERGTFHPEQPSKEKKNKPSRRGRAHARAVVKYFIISSSFTQRRCLFAVVVCSFANQRASRDHTL